MATLREYYEKDLSHYLKLHIKVPLDSEGVEGMLIFDFTGHFSFLVLYVPQQNKDLSFFIKLVSNIKPGHTQLHLAGEITLPAAKDFYGQFRVENKVDFEVLAQYFGDTDWMSTKDIQSSGMVFIYSETNLNAKEIVQLKSKAKELGYKLQFRDKNFEQERNKHEKPFAFISYDSRDRKEVAERIAIGLQSMLCPVWYDEYSLKVGYGLRESIEKGLKECKKCILVLSPSFLSNNGWTKTEFDSIFTRQILEEQKLVLPVWFKISKQDVFNYSPSLLNIKGLIWGELGEEEACRQLYKAIMD